MKSCCFNKKNVFPACIGDQAKNLKMVNLRFFNPLISKHITNLFRKIQKLRNLVCLFEVFGLVPPFMYTTYKHTMANIAVWLSCYVYILVMFLYLATVNHCFTTFFFSNIMCHWKDSH